MHIWELVVNLITAFYMRVACALIRMQMNAITRALILKLNGARRHQIECMH